MSPLSSGCRQADVVDTLDIRYKRRPVNDVSGGIDGPRCAHASVADLKLNEAIRPSAAELDAQISGHDLLLVLSTEIDTAGGDNAFATAGRARPRTLLAESQVQVGLSPVHAEEGLL